MDDSVSDTSDVIEPWAKALLDLSWNLPLILEIMDFLKQKPTDALILQLLKNTSMGLDTTEAKFPNKILGSSSERLHKNHVKTGANWILKLPVQPLGAGESEDDDICEDCHQHIIAKKITGRRKMPEKDQTLHNCKNGCSVNELFNKLQPQNAITPEEHIDHGRQLIEMLTRCRDRHVHLKGLMSRSSETFVAFIRKPYEAAAALAEKRIPVWWDAFNSYVETTKARSVNLKPSKAATAAESMHNFQSLRSGELMLIGGSSSDTSSPFSIGSSDYKRNIFNSSPYGSLAMDLPHIIKRTSWDDFGRRLKEFGLMVEREKEDTLLRIKADLEEHVTHIDILKEAVDRAIVTWRRPSAVSEEQTRITRDAIKIAFPGLSEPALWSAQSIVIKNEMNLGFLGHLDYWKLKLSQVTDAVTIFEIKQTIKVLFDENM